MHAVGLGQGGLDQAPLKIERLLLEIQPVAFLCRRGRRFPGRSEQVRETVRGDDLVPAEDDRPLDEVFELADVSRPGVTVQDFQDIGADALDRLAVLPGEDV